MIFEIMSLSRIMARDVMMRAMAGIRTKAILPCDSYMDWMRG
jgi:hypothetical protein